MLITSGKVQDGSVELDDSLPEGSRVVVLMQEDAGSFELSLEDESKLLAAIGEAERNDVVEASAVLDRIRQ